MTSEGGLPTEDDVRRERAARRTIEDQQRREPGCPCFVLLVLPVLAVAVIFALAAGRVTRGAE